MYSCFFPDLYLATWCMDRCITRYMRGTRPSNGWKVYGAITIFIITSKTTVVLVLAQLCGIMYLAHCLQQKLLTRAFDFNWVFCLARARVNTEVRLARIPCFHCLTLNFLFHCNRLVLWWGLISHHLQIFIDRWWIRWMSYYLSVSESSLPTNCGCPVAGSQTSLKFLSGACSLQEQFHFKFSSSVIIQIVCNVYY